MSIPAVILIVFASISLLIAAHDHGKLKTGRDNFWMSLIVWVAVMAVLITGGFFK